jgi:hypothetical protein
MIIKKHSATKTTKRRRITDRVRDNAPGPVKDNESARSAPTKRWKIGAIERTPGRSKTER